MNYIKIDGINCHYQKLGTKGKKVVLLHGWGQNLEMMDYIAYFLKDHFTVYSLDFPGFGKSDEPNRPFSVMDYCLFLRKFLLSLGVEKPIFIAHSFGCRVALHYAKDYPVLRMVLTGAAGVRDKHSLIYYCKIYSYKLLKKILSLKPFKKYLTILQNKVGSEDYKNTSGIMRATLVKVVNDDVSPFLADIDVETLLVFGENDEATPIKKGYYMEKRMPNATLVIFEKDDHFAYFNQYVRFNRVLDAFLKRDYD